MKTKALTILIFFGFGLQNKAQYQGCYFGNGSLPIHNLTSNSGNPQLDAINQREYNLLSQIFTVRPNFVYLLDHDIPNAYATSAITNANFPDGTIMLGFNLIQEECLKSYSGTCSSVPIILAHEFAHILDFKFGTGLSWKYKELFADYIAGSYLYYRAQVYGGINISEVAISFFSKGNYEFNNPNFHGTPQERYTCLDAGYRLAQQYAASGQNLSLPILMSSALQYVRQF